MGYEIKLRYMQIAVIAGGLGTGGAEKQLIYFCLSLYKNGHEVSVYSLTRSDINERFLIQHGIPVYFFGRYNFFLIRLLLLLYILLVKSPKLIISFHTYTNIYSGLVGKILNIKSVGGVRGQVDRLFKIYGKFLSYILLSINSYLLFNSQTSIEYATNKRIRINKKNTILFLSNVIDIHDVQKYRNKIIKKNKRLKAVFLGRLVKSKGIWDLLEAMQIIGSKNRELIQFVIIGGGQEEKNIRQVAFSNFSEDEIIFKGELEIEKVYEELAAADFFIFPSHSEGCPNSVLEAMAFGLPIIASSVGDIPLLIKHAESGLLIQPSNPRELALMIKKVLYNFEKTKLLGINAKNIIIERYSIQHFYDNISTNILSRIEY